MVAAEAGTEENLHLRCDKAVTTYPILLDQMKTELQTILGSTYHF